MRLQREATLGILLLAGPALSHSFELVEAKKQIELVKKYNSCEDKSINDVKTSVNFKFKGPKYRLDNILGAKIKTDFSESHVSFKKGFMDNLYPNRVGFKPINGKLNKNCQINSCTIDFSVSFEELFPEGYDNEDLEFSLLNSNYSTLFDGKVNVRNDNIKYKDDSELNYDAYFEKGNVVTRKFSDETTNNYFDVNLNIGINDQIHSLGVTVTKSQIEESLVLSYPALNSISYLSISIKDSEHLNSENSSSYSSKIELFNDKDSFFSDCRAEKP